MEPAHQRDPTVLLHFSEDPTIERFVPHIPATNRERPPMVWTIDELHAPLFWFPRECPRITFWADDGDVPDRLGPTSAHRVHAIEAAWLERVRQCELYAYQFEPTPFAPWPEANGYWTTLGEVAPLAVVPMGDLLQRHVDAGIELRIVSNLAPLRQRVMSSGYAFSMARMANAG